MTIFDQKSKKFLHEYLNNAAPTGFEAPGQKLWMKYIEPFVDELDHDTYGSAFGIINPGKDYRVVIEAHADEISWFVNHISKEGFIRVIRNGGSDHAIAPSKRVDIHGEKGIVKGLFGWPAIHTRKGKNTNLAPTVENIFIDVGAKNRDEVIEMGIQVGAVITYEDELIELNDKYYVGRALDNKMGGFCIAQVAKMLSANKKSLPYSLYIVNAVQEEIGLRGAQMIANTINPDCAIITDVTHDTSTPLVEPKKLGEINCGDGPSVTFAPSVHNQLLNLIIETAKKKKINIQREVASRSTGTDTDAFAYTGRGIPSALISLPLRYMHTTVEMAHKDDIEDVIKLIYETLIKLDPKQKFSYL
jgi:putative aminopeptidase FrvX